MVRGDLVGIENDEVVRRGADGDRGVPRIKSCSPTRSGPSAITRTDQSLESVAPSVEMIRTGRWQWGHSTASAGESLGTSTSPPQLHCTWIIGE